MKLKVTHPRLPTQTCLFQISHIIVGQGLLLMLQSIALSHPKAKMRSKDFETLLLFWLYYFEHVVHVIIDAPLSHYENK